MPGISRRPREQALPPGGQSVSRNRILDFLRNPMPVYWPYALCTLLFVQYPCPSVQSVPKNCFPIQGGQFIGYVKKIDLAPIRVQERVGLHKRLFRLYKFRTMEKLNNKVLIVTARDMNKNERKRYAKK
jgi:hypothetical protein